MDNFFLVGKEVYLHLLEESDVYTGYPSWLNDGKYHDCIRCSILRFEWL
jgi:hypothetical protein